jgi:ligand-binding sensor domain-containing protein
MKALRLDATTSKVTGSVDGPAGANAGLAIDANGRDLFAWTENGAVKQFNATTMATVHSAPNTLPSGVMIFEGAVLSGKLWLTTDHGLFVISFEGNAAQAAEIAGLTNVYALTADPARHRMLVGAYAGDGFTTRVVAVDDKTHALTPGGGLPFGKESIAVVGDKIWAGGYGDDPTARLVQIDTRTLQRIGPSAPVNADLGPGAILWAGQHVLWVRSGGSEQLDCLDPVTGKVLQTWPEVQGPVSSVAGAAYAAHNGVVQKLTLNQACEG